MLVTRVPDAFQVPGSSVRGDEAQAQPLAIFKRPGIIEATVDDILDEKV